MQAKLLREKLVSGVDVEELHDKEWVSGGVIQSLNPLREDGSASVPAAPTAAGSAGASSSAGGRSAGRRSSAAAQEAAPQLMVHTEDDFSPQSHHQTRNSNLIMTIFASYHKTMFSFVSLTVVWTALFLSLFSSSIHLPSPPIFSVDTVLFPFLTVARAGADPRRVSPVPR